MGWGSRYHFEKSLIWVWERHIQSLWMSKDVSLLAVSSLLVALVSWEEEMFTKCAEDASPDTVLSNEVTHFCWCMLSSALSILWTTQRSKLQLLSWPCVLLVALLCPSMTQIHIISFYDSYYLWDLGLL